MDHTFFGLQVLIGAAGRGDPARAELGALVRASPERVELAEKRLLYQRVRGLLQGARPRIERGYWDYIPDPARAEAEFEKWCSELEQLANDPRPAAADAYRAGSAGAALFTMAFLLVKGQAADEVAAERCDVAEPDFFKRSVFEALVALPPQFNFATVRADAIYVVPGDDDDGLTPVELADEGWSYLRPLT